MRSHIRAFLSALALATHGTIPHTFQWLLHRTHTHYHTENVFRKRFLHSVNRKSVEYLLIELD